MYDSYYFSSYLYVRRFRCTIPKFTKNFYHWKNARYDCKSVLKKFKTFPSYTLVSIYRGESSRSTAHLTDHF